DGTGGALALSFVQQLKSNNQPLPAKLYLFSPMLDAKLDNENITDDLIDKDVIINIEGLQKIMKVWSGNLPLNDNRYHQLMENYLVYHPYIYLVAEERFTYQI